MKSISLVCLRAALSAPQLFADVLTTDYTTHVTMGTDASSTEFSGGYSADTFSLTGTDTLNFSSHNSVSFLIGAGGGSYAYNASSTDSGLSLLLVYGTTSAGMTALSNYAVNFLDESDNVIAVAYGSASPVFGSNATYPDGVQMIVDLSALPTSFSFTTIRVDLDYSTYAGGTISSQDISLSNGSIQFWAASGASYTQLVTYTVPEPATYAAIFGVAGLGAAFASRRRRKV